QREQSRPLLVTDAVLVEQPPEIVAADADVRGLDPAQLGLRPAEPTGYVGDRAVGAFAEPAQLRSELAAKQGGARPRCHHADHSVILRHMLQHRRIVLHLHLRTAACLIIVKTTTVSVQVTPPNSRDAAMLITP